VACSGTTRAYPELEIGIDPLLHKTYEYRNAKYPREEKGSHKLTKTEFHPHDEEHDPDDESADCAAENECANYKQRRKHDA
jgi:hypothetical protein